jgi:hypothetical protein
MFPGLLQTGDSQAAKPLEVWEAERESCIQKKLPEEFARRVYQNMSDLSKKFVDIYSDCRAF